MLNIIDKIMLIFKKYGLHDTAINEIELCANGMKFIFNNGIYLLNENGKEKGLTEKCKIELLISNFNFGEISENIEIFKIYKKKIYEINFQEFLKLLKQGNFEIKYNFVSNFNNTLLFKGFIGKNKFEFLISNIIEIGINFD